MDWQAFFYLIPHLILTVIPLLIGIILSAGIAYYAWRRRSVPAAKSFTIFMIAAIIWSTGMLLSTVSATQRAQSLWMQISHLGVIIMPVAWLAFTLKYTGQDRWLPAEVWMLLAIIPLLKLIQGIIVSLLGGYLPVSTDAVMNWTNGLYSTGLLLVGAFLMGLAMIRSPMYQGHFITLILGSLLPWTIALLELVGLTPLSSITLVPLAFAVASVFNARGIITHQVFDIMPVALDTVIASMSDGVIILDAQHRVINMNPAAEEMTGHRSEDVMGSDALEVLNRDEKLIAQLSEATEPWEKTLSHKAQGRFYEMHISPLFNHRHILSGRLLLLHDITERVKTEEALRQAKEEAEAANRAKSVFLANMSHELRTPLNAILGFSTIMDRDPNTTPEQRENLQTIRRSGEHLLTLINDVLQMSKIEAGRTALYEQGFDLHRLLEATEDMFRLRAAKKDLQLIFDRAPDVPQYVTTDESKLRQVLMNLVSNAIKFTAEGGVTVRVGYSDERLLFEVEDTGVGIPQEELDSLFDPFVQTASGKQSEEGTGLGLAISQQFIHLMDGKINVASEPGHGSLFRFDVRVKPASAEDVEEERAQRQVIGLAPDQPTYRILVAEDRDANRELLIKLLEPLGFEIRGVTNGQEAIEMWKSWYPHLILMDMRMPVMDGYEATRRIKDTTKGQATVIVALTASAFDEDRAVILSGGCDDFVRKPFRQEELFEVFHKHLGVKFIYEKELDGTDGADVIPTDQLSATHLSVLKLEQRKALHEAAMQADAERIKALTASFQDDHPEIVHALRALVHNFRFDVIMEVSAEYLSAESAG